MQHYSVQEIDERTRRGLNIGEFQGPDAPEVPKFVQDWSIHVIHFGQTHGEIVAVPTNSRTRELYNLGRKTWLENLGYNEEQAQRYIRVSQPYKHRWDKSIAKFVIDNMEMTDDTWYDITRAKQPGVRAQDLGIVVKMSESRLNSAMQILMNMWEQAPVVTE